MKNLSTLIILSLLILLAHANNSTSNSTNTTNASNSSNTTNDTDVVEPYTYCSAQCVDYVQVCSDVYFGDCIICATSLYEQVPIDGSCSLLDQHEVIHSELQMSSLSLGGYSASSLVPVMCDKYTFSGAYVQGGFISKSFNNLPLNHYQIVIRFNVGYIGSWNASEEIYLSADSTITTFNASCDSSEDLCSGSQADCIRIREAIVQHNASSVTLNFTSSMTQTDSLIQYWGIKDLIIGVRKCHSQCTTCYGPLSSDCITCEDGFYLQGNKCLEECTGLKIEDKKQCVEVCPQGYYQNSKQCSNCQGGCAVCFNEDLCLVWNDGTVGNSIWDRYLLLWILIIMVAGVLLFLMVYKCLKSKNKVDEENMNIQESMIPNNEQTREMVEIESVHENQNDFFWNQNDVRVSKRKKRKNSPKQANESSVQEVQITEQNLKV